MQTKDQLEHYTSGDFLKINTDEFSISAIISYLIAKPNIKKLEITYDIIHEGGIKDLVKCNSIYSLAIIKSSKLLKLNHIIDISQNNNITKLNLHSYSFGDEGAKYIARSKSIKELFVTVNTP